LLQFNEGFRTNELGMTTFFLVLIAIGVATLIGAFVFAAFTL
jgi:hypothetical protein